MKCALLISTLLLFSGSLLAQTDEPTERDAIARAAMDYIESQHTPSAKMMLRGIDPKLKKRTYWQNKMGDEFILETSAEFMVELAGSYNKNGDKFPEKPMAKVTILDIDQKVASVKLEADEWIDYMHLYKNDRGEWKILNVLWQYKDVSKHK